MRNNKTQKLVINAILIALGAILHQVTPALGLPMQPDFALAMLFIIMFINKDYKTSLISAIILGVFTALTTKFPGGQLPNIIDKVVTIQVAYMLMKVTEGRMNETLRQGIIFGVCTFVSGVTFLGSALILVGLPAGASFGLLIATVVVPAVIINIPVGIALYRLIEKTGRYAKVSI